MESPDLSAFNDALNALKAAQLAVADARVAEHALEARLHRAHNALLSRQQALREAELAVALAMRMPREAAAGASPYARA